VTYQSSCLIHHGQRCGGEGTAEWGSLASILQEVHGGRVYRRSRGRGGRGPRAT
jgi:hypothetical protein